ncbi:helix-turn-helix domain-containing protein [Qipengyuania marisflavi]|uniref:Helix-turn-helix transcriptional regulator n=1 Tax=Qipengyuania marisflavi TaxID=2486356 RepID=A0A5S3P569_9SPHN|nr:helix-turn-helix domain-containing protein [Qipengyuania marisflavi]TMM48094.1 helix-turn-helix transcriptional regulator [Qipengyuania marisflavi]
MGLHQHNDTGAKPDNLVSHTGQTRDGHPLAFNHAPAEDLRPWFTWFSATDATLPDGAELQGSMLNDLPCLRIMFGGKSRAETRDGTVPLEPGIDGGAYYFGPHSRAMQITMSGTIKVITVQLGPGAATAMGGPAQPDMIDRIVEHSKLVGHGELARRFCPDDTPDKWLAALERELRKFLGKFGARSPDPITQAFEMATLRDPTMTLLAFAEDQRVTPRTVERIIKRDYGLPPKQVLRRARALDLAAALMGVAMEDEEAELRLRYFDQSHQIRELRHFFGMTPRQFKQAPHSLLRLNLEVRQARRIEALDLLPQGAIQPWRDPSAEPNGAA